MLDVTALSVLTLLPGGTKIPTTARRKANAAIRMVRNQVDTIIEARKQKKSAANSDKKDKDNNDNNDNNGEEEKATDLLGIMIDARDDKGEPVFTNSNLVDQVTNQSTPHTVIFYILSCKVTR
jgi:cytochrome P450